MFKHFILNRRNNKIILLHEAKRVTMDNQANLDIYNKFENNKKIANNYTKPSKLNETQLESILSNFLINESDIDSFSQNPIDLLVKSDLQKIAEKDLITEDACREYAKKQIRKNLKSFFLTLEFKQKQNEQIDTSCLFIIKLLTDFYDNAYIAKILEVSVKEFTKNLERYILLYAINKAENSIEDALNVLDIISKISLEVNSIKHIDLIVKLNKKLIIEDNEIHSDFNTITKVRNIIVNTDSKFYAVCDALEALETDLKKSQQEVRKNEALVSSYCNIYPELKRAIVNSRFSIN